MRKLALALLLTMAATGMVMASTLAPDLVAKLKTSTENDFVRIMVTMEAQGDLDLMQAATAGLDKQATRELVVGYLQNLAQTTQADVKAYLESKQTEGKVRNLQSVFIVNLLHCQATPEVIWELQNFSGVAEVSYDPEQYMLFYEQPQQNSPQTDETDEIAWGVADINAPAVWAQGYNGTGVIVGMIDTGVNYNHNDLTDHMWNGGVSYPHHGWDFYNNDNDPMDDGVGYGAGHGTHTAGSVGSDGTAGSQCGVAPNATIMAIKVLSGTGYGTEGPVISGINFAVAQGADIFSMSLGWQTTSQRAQFRTACNNALAAGVIGSIAAGNEGQQQFWYPIPGNVRTPGDVPPPWLNPQQTLTGGLSCVVTIGATNSAHQAAGFSSHGPSTWEGLSPWNDYPYSGGAQMGLIDPDVAAPGENIKSCAYNNVNGYLDGWSGTSMAAPHVAGTMALMLDKNPSLTPAQIDQYLETTSLDWGSAGKDNTFGAGRIDAAAAVAAVPGGTPPDVTINLTPTGSTALPASGGTLTFTVDIHNNGTSTAYMQGWLEWTYPNGSSSGALLTRNIVLAASGTLSRSMSQTVAGSEPNGSYTFWGRLGTSYGGTVYAQDSFPFTKGTSNLGSGEWMATTSTSGWEEDMVSTTIPEVYSLGQNYPNPFNPTTIIPFSLPNSGQVSLKVYDVRGNEVATVLAGELSAGQYQVSFDASSLSSGLYFYRLQAGEVQKTMKFMLVK